MSYLVLAKYKGSFGKWEVVATYEGITVEEAQEKLCAIYDRNKGFAAFEGLEMKLHEGNFIETGLGVGSL